MKRPDEVRGLAQVARVHGEALLRVVRVAGSDREDGRVLLLVGLKSLTVFLLLFNG